MKNKFNTSGVKITPDIIKKTGVKAKYKSVYRYKWLILSMDKYGVFKMYSYKSKKEQVRWLKSYIHCSDAVAIGLDADDNTINFYQTLANLHVRALVKFGRFSR